MNEWYNFKDNIWKNEINVENFIETNYKEYTDDYLFLKPISLKTSNVWKKCQESLKEENIKHVLDIDCNDFSGIDKNDEVIYGLQTDAVLKRIVNPYGGVKLAEKELDIYGYDMHTKIEEFKKYRKTHNDGVFDAYDETIKKARHAGLLTGLPDAYGRGRIIGDYRRVALYGIDFLIKQKQNDFDKVLIGPMSENLIRLREEVSEQIKALKSIKEMANSYGFEISKPAKTAKEAINLPTGPYLPIPIIAISIRSIPYKSIK